MTSSDTGKVLTTGSSLAFSYSTVRVRSSVPPESGVKTKPMVPLLPASMLPRFCTEVMVWISGPSMVAATLPTGDLPLFT